MFRAFANFLPKRANELVQLHPADLTALLELAFERRSNQINLELGDPFRRSDLLGFGSTIFGSKLLTTGSVKETPGQPNVNPLLQAIDLACPILWDHLIYAYMIENTRIYEIFRRVIHEFLHGEKLGVPGLRPRRQASAGCAPPKNSSTATRRRSSITTITSHVRTDIQATGRNAYQRMFGMDLNHGTEDNKPYPYIKAEAANNEFVSTFEEFLREVWIGMENVQQHQRRQPDRRREDRRPGRASCTTCCARAREAGNLSARGVRLRLDDVVVPPDAGDATCQSCKILRAASREPRRAPVQDRPAGRHAGAWPVEELLRHRRQHLAGS